MNALVPSRAGFFSRFKSRFAAAAIPALPLQHPTAEQLLSNIRRRDQPLVQEETERDIASASVMLREFGSPFFLAGNPSIVFQTDGVVRRGPHDYDFEVLFPDSNWSTLNSFMSSHDYELTSRSINEDGTINWNIRNPFFQNIHANAPGPGRMEIHVLRRDSVNPDIVHASFHGHDIPLPARYYGADVKTVKLNGEDVPLGPLAAKVFFKMFLAGPQRDERKHMNDLNTVLPSLTSKQLQEVWDLWEGSRIYFTGEEIARFENNKRVLLQSRQL